MATINPALLNYFDLPPGPYYGSLFEDTGFASGTPAPPSPAVNGSIDDVRIDLTPVPEPTSVLFLATVIIICGIGVKARKHVSRS